MTQGKIIGLIAFILMEIIIIFFSVWIFIRNDLSYINAIIASQTGVLTIVWGAKASSNFRRDK